MKLMSIKRLMLGVAVALVFLPGVLTTSAEAQTRVIRRPVVVYRPFYRYYNPFYRPFYDPFWGDPYWGPSYRTVDPIAYEREQGYSKGRSKGKDDAKKGLAANPTAQKDYIKSNSLAYREAFVKGYNERYQEKLAEISKEQGEKPAS